MSATPPVRNRDAIAVDYSRFSGMSQEYGDSKRRQKSLADRWSDRTGVPIDVRLSDDGVSGRDARRRADADRYGLAEFLSLVNSGRVRPGDFLLLENFDRLSREEECPAAHLLFSILVAGVRVVQLAPYEVELTAKSDMFALFRAVMELSRGHGESERKHQLCSASYANNRAAAADGEETYQGALPSWLRRGGRGKGARHRPIEAIPDRVAVVQRIFTLAADGCGYTEIVRTLNGEGVPCFGDRAPRIDPETGEQARTRNGRLRWRLAGERIGSGKWSRSYIVTILRGKSAMGQLVTRTGQVVPIPAAVTEDEWMAAQAGRAERDKHRGRTRQSGPVNLWAGLLRHEDTNDGFFSIVRQGRGKTWRVLANAAGKQCEVELVSFPEDAFEGALLRCLKEIDVALVVGKQGPDLAAVRAGRLEDVRRQLAELQAELAACVKSPRSALAILASLEEEGDRLEEDRRRTEHAAKHPVSEAWGRVQSLIDVASDPEHRLRLRSALRRIVEEIRVVIVPRGWDRVAAVQVCFKESAERRNYLLVYRKDVMPDGRKASRRRRERGEDACVVRSMVERPGLDLRNRDHVAALREELLKLDLAQA